MSQPPAADSFATGGAPVTGTTRARRHAGAGFSFALAVVLGACGVAPVLQAPPPAAPSTVSEAPARPAEAPATAVPPEAAPRPAERPAATITQPAPPADRPAETRVAPAKPRPAEERRAAESIPLPRPAPEIIESRRPTPLPPRREPIPQVRPGDDVVELAAVHGFDPVPVPVPENTRFSRLRLGMTKQDAEALLGRPDSALHYANEGARIPFYASDDSSRWETFYRGQGRLMFSGAWLTGEVRLIRIEFDPEEDGRPDPDHPQRR